MEKYEFDQLVDRILESNNETKEAIEETYKSVDKFMSVVYEFVLTYHDYLYTRVEYGLGFKHTMIEIHVLTDINDNPGINTTSLANRWSRNISTMSSLLSGLESEGLIYREMDPDNRKILRLYVTELGEELTLSHKKYDNISIKDDFNKLLETATVEDLRGFHNISSELRGLIADRMKNEE